MSQPVMHGGGVASLTQPEQVSLLREYLDMRRTSARMCAPLSVEDHCLQPMPDASPAKWHLAHTTWFFETFVLSQFHPQYRPSHPEFRSLFNSYYNTIGDRPLRALRHILSRPSLDEVRLYRSQVDDAIAGLMERELPVEALDLITLGIHHEQQHQELIVTDVKNGLWSNPLRPAYRTTPISRAVREAPPLRWQGFPEGLYPIGFEGEGFAFDNEGPRHNFYLQPFRLASRLATNAEYLEFVRDGAYSTPTLWLSDGWDTVRANQWTAPLYWEQRDGEWRNYTIEGMQPLRPDEPVCHISFYEADAFARWSGARLPTEFEWETAAGSRHIIGNFQDSFVLHPLPASDDPLQGMSGVPAEQSGANRELSGSPGIDRLTQMFGDVWEWTASAYTPYPNFKPAAGAVGEYNGKFMCNQMVLRGGSCATPLSHIRASYRNFFPPHVRWQFMGVRLANGD